MQFSISLMYNVKGVVSYYRIQSHDIPKQFVVKNYSLINLICITKTTGGACVAHW